MEKPALSLRILLPWAWFNHSCCCSQCAKEQGKLELLWETI